MHVTTARERAARAWVVAWVGVADDGCRLRLEVPEDLTGDLLSRWPPTGLIQGEDLGSADRCISVAPARPGSGRDIEVRVDGVPVEGGWCRVESDLALFAAEHLVGRVAVHAGVAVWGGVAVLLPGRSHAGKSTLCLALSDIGVQVRSDEYALVDGHRALVTGWQRPMRRRRGDGAGIDRVGLANTENQPVPVALVAALRYQPERVGPSGSGSWAAVGGRRSAEVLLRNTVSARAQPEEAFGAAIRVARGAFAVEGRRGEAHDAARSLVALLDDLVG